MFKYLFLLYNNQPDKFCPYRPYFCVNSLTIFHYNALRALFLVSLHSRYRTQDLKSYLRRFAPFCIGNYPQARSRGLAIERLRRVLSDASNWYRIIFNNSLLSVALARAQSILPLAKTHEMRYNNIPNYYTFRGKKCLSILLNRLNPNGKNIGKSTKPLKSARTLPFPKKSAAMFWTCSPTPARRACT